MKKRLSLKTITIVLLLFYFASFLCLSQELSQPVYQVIEELDVKVSMRDGVRLSTNIYRPDTLGNFPVLLMRTPYGNGGEDNKEGHFYAQRGYVVVVQDTRGRYESEGLFDAFRYEASDGYDTQQWVGKQPWCNEKIGTFGGSYVGFTQWMPAPLQSPYLITMVPAVTFSDVHDVVYQGGAFRLALFSPWSFEMTHTYNIDQDFIGSRTDSILQTLPLMEQDRYLGWKIPFLRDWLAHPEHDRYWDRTSVGDDGYKKIRTSVYNIGGWFDIVLDGTLQNFIRMTDTTIAPEVRTKQKLLIGPWIHGWGKSKVGELDFGEAATIDSRELHLRWFDSELKGKNTGIMEEPPVKIFVMGENIWRFENEWPLARTKYQKYYFYSKGKANTLSGDGFLNVKLPKDDPTDTFTYDPENPVPTPGSMGPYDQKDLEKREDVLVYSTKTLKKDIEVTGPVKVILYAASSAVNTDFTAKLVDVFPDGKAIRLCEGIIRANFRDPDTTTSNIQPGKVYKYHIDLWATSNVFKKGHKVRVEISSSSFPRFDRNLNTGNFFATDTTYVKATQTIYHSRDYPSCIVLPVIE
jgi:putative CocE/NonD family hydrolase